MDELDTFKINVGKRIKSLRKSRGFSQENLAEYTGLSVNWVSLMETGKANFTFDILHNLSKVLNVRAIEFFNFIPSSHISSKKEKKAIMTNIPDNINNSNERQEEALRYESFGRKLEDLCRKLNIQVEDIFPILNDQKVLPMLRGKASEYDAVFRLKQVLDSEAWIVNKLNLNAQPGLGDQDIGVRHRKTGIEIIVETKNAVRGSMRAGPRGKKHQVPHFKVKSHRSRSNLNQPYNDRYLMNEFDLIISTPTNAMFKGGTVGENFELLSASEIVQILYDHYEVNDPLALVDAANKDWRFVEPSAIAEDVAGYRVIPRTPFVLLKDDPNWQPLARIQATLEKILTAKITAARKKPGHN